MTICVSNLAVAAGAKAGTIVGALAAFAAGKPAAASFRVDSDSLFAIDAHGNLTVGAALAAGYYGVRLYAVAGDEVIDEADFVVDVS